MTLRVALYARVSTQDEDCARQITDLAAYAQARGFSVVSVHQEKVSDRNDNRKERWAVLAMAQSRRIDAILVKELSRWGRSTPDLLSSLSDLEGWGVSLIAMSGMTFDLTTATGRMIATVLAGVADFEATLARERIKSGLASARAKGKQLGRQTGDAPAVRRHRGAVLKLRQEGVPLKQIAMARGISINTVRKIVRGDGVDREAAS